MPIDTFPEWLRAHTPLPLPSGEDLHSWLGATAYVWSLDHDDRQLWVRTSLTACPLTRFLVRQGVQDPQALRWHALTHESAYEQERKAALRALLQWMEQQVLEERAAKP
jgi:hypothetical protein